MNFYLLCTFISIKIPLIWGLFQYCLVSLSTDLVRLNYIFEKWSVKVRIKNDLDEEIQRRGLKMKYKDIFLEAQNAIISNLKSMITSSVCLWS